MAGGPGYSRNRQQEDYNVTHGGIAHGIYTDAPDQPALPDIIPYPSYEEFGDYLVYNVRGPLAGRPTRSADISGRPTRSGEIQWGPGAISQAVPGTSGAMVAAGIAIVAILGLYLAAKYNR